MLFRGSDHGVLCTSYGTFFGGCQIPLYLCDRYFVLQYQGSEEKSAPEGEAGEGEADDTLSDLRDDDEDSVSALVADAGACLRPLGANKQDTGALVRGLFSSCSQITTKGALQERTVNEKFRYQTHLDLFHL